MKSHGCGEHQRTMENAQDEILCNINLTFLQEVVVIRISYTRLETELRTHQPPLAITNSPKKEILPQHTCHEKFSGTCMNIKKCRWSRMQKMSDIIQHFSLP